MTVVSPLQAQTIERSAVEQGYALNMRYQQKWRKYGEACKTEGIVFYPMPVECLGGWHDVAAGIICRLGQSLARSTGQVETEVVRHLFGRLSVLLVKGNTALILNRTPSHPEPQIDGNY